MADLDALQKAGVTQLRILGSTEGPDSEPWRIVPSLQPCPGVYNAAVLDGFDFLVAEMGKRRMRATVVMGDEWAWSGGHAQLVRWAQKQAGPPNAAACAAAPRLQPNISDPSWRQRGFEDIPYPGPGGNSWSDYQALSGLLYTTPAAQALWEKHVTFLTSHVNAYTGLRLSDDPVIMAWQLANEPRAASEDAKPAFFAWLDGASRFLKAAAPRQLVCAGGEGDTAYFSPSQALAASQAMPALDYVTAHLWVQNWGRYHPAMTEQAFVNSTIAWALKYVAASAAEASRLRKPLVLEEFGLPRDLGSLSPAAPTTRRNVYFATIFRSITDSAAAQGVLAGANFWAFAGRGRPGAAGIPATSAQLCKGAAVPGGPPMRSFTGAPPDWGACFTDQGSRPAACSADSWWAVQSAWPPGSPPGLDAFLGDPPHESQGKRPAAGHAQSATLTLPALCLQAGTLCTAPTRR